MRVLSVTVPAADFQVESVHRRALATLPGRFQVVTGPSADVAFISCRTPQWVEHAIGAVARGCAVVLARPVAGDAASLAEVAAAADAANTVATVAQPFADDPSWRAALPEMVATHATLLESVVTVGDVGDLAWATVAQLAAVRLLLDPAVTLTGRRGRDHYVLSGTSGGLVVSLSGVVSPAGSEGCRIAVVGAAVRWEAWVPGDETARAAVISRFDADGARVSRPHYANAARAGWIAVHEAMIGDGGALDDLAAVLRDIRRCLPIGVG